MDRIISSSQQQSLLSTHKVLRNTYFLLGLTLAFSAVTATLSTVYALPSPGLILMLVGFYGLMFLTYRGEQPGGYSGRVCLYRLPRLLPRSDSQLVPHRRYG